MRFTLSTYELSNIGAIPVYGPGCACHVFR